MSVDKLKDSGLAVCAGAQDCTEETCRSWRGREDPTSVGSPAAPCGQHLSSSPQGPGEAVRFAPSISRRRKQQLRETGILPVLPQVEKPGRDLSPSLSAPTPGKNEAARGVRACVCRERPPSFGFQPGRQ